MGGRWAVLRGAGAGMAATVPMSAVMLVAQRAGQVGSQPPERVAESAAGAAGVRLPERASDAAGVAAHLGFGAGVGASYAVLCSRTPLGRLPCSGVAWALVVYVASYLGWLPALGILPSASDDRKDRVTTMVAAHVVFGAALDSILRPDRPRRKGSA